jgi:hypothetical protein
MYTLSTVRARRAVSVTCASKHVQKPMFGKIRVKKCKDDKESKKDKDKFEHIKQRCTDAWEKLSDKRAKTVDELLDGIVEFAQDEIDFVNDFTKAWQDDEEEDDLEVKPETDDKEKDTDGKK